MAGITPLSHGSLKIKGMDPNEARSFIGYVPQNSQINWNFPLSVKQVVEMGLITKNTFNPFSNRKNDAIVEDSLNKVGLIEKISENINNFSQFYLLSFDLIAKLLLFGDRKW